MEKNFRMSMDEDILNESGFEEERDSFMQPPTRSLRNFALVNIGGVYSFFFASEMNSHELCIGLKNRSFLPN